MTRQEWIMLGVGSLLTVALLLLPNYVNRFTIFLLYTLFVNISLAQSWNLVGGYTGLISLGHAAFLGIGAYTAAICMTTLGLPFVVAILAGALLATLFACLIAFPTFRFRGIYFAIGTLILGEALRIWMINWAWTGGAQGIRFPIGRGPTLTQFYYLMLFMTVAVTILLVAITRSKLGLGLRAIRDNEGGAQNLGVNVFRTKLTAFAISAFIVGLVGAIHGTRLSTIEPYSIFGISWTISMVNTVIIGGMGTVIGPIIGAIFVTYLGEALASLYSIHLILTGIIFVLVIRFMPEGIWGWLSNSLLPRLLPKQQAQTAGGGHAL